jgi:hypothetical protein
LYGCETWFLPLKEEYRLKVFENSVLRRIFRSKSSEIVGGWRKLHNEELRNLYSSSEYDYIYEVKEDEMDRACSMYVGEGFGGNARRKEATRKSEK